MADSSDPGRSDGATSSGGASGHGAFRLPPSLLESAAKRICILSVFVAGLVVVVHLGLQLAQPQLRPVMADPVNRLVTLASVLTACGLFALGHFRLVPASTLIGLGMVFEVIVALSISMFETALPMTPGVPVTGVSSLGLWVFAVGVLIPNRPIWTLVTALAAASTWPAAYAINAARFDFPDVPMGQLLVWPTINYLLAGLAYLVGRWTYGTSIAAQTAQDLGSYRLIARIGEGGMGEVWKAEHQMLARAAAIKIVKPDVLNQSSARQADVSVKRFKREANIIASLQSPHTVYLYDFGVTKEGYLYYIMELLDGISLETLVRTFGPLPAPRAAALVRQICESLEEAHQQGLIHRDLKPSNIMVCKLALSHDFIKVLDFGLAKAVQSAEVSQLTMEGTTTGTPGYMAPEIAMGEARVDAKADIYALGCVAYFLLTGQMVFTDSNPMAMALNHVRTEPTPPSSRTELPIPASIERVIMQCLAKKPEDRPGSARDVARLVSACDLTTWTDDDATAWWDRHLPPTSTLRSFAQDGAVTPAVVQRA